MFESLKNFPFDIEEHNPTKVWFSCQHTEESKKLISEMKKGIKQSPGHIQNRVKSTIGFKQSEHQKKTAANVLSSDWLITDPIGKSYKIKNLRSFCKEHNLDQGNMVKVSKGIIKQNKGWKCIKLEA